MSIVTPSYNQVQFIEETIRSVLLQGYPDLEYIIVDGGSTDGSVEIIRKYEPWLAYWVSEPDNGQSEAINKGFARATGDVLAWLCSDDTYRPGALGAVARYLHDHPHVGLVYGDCMMIDEESRPLKPAPRPSEFDPERMFADLDFLTQPAAFFRQEAYRAAGGLDPALHYHMDPDLWYRIGHLYRVERIPQVLANARIYPGTKTVSGGEGRWQELFALIRKYGDGTISRYQRAHYHLSTGRDAYKAGDDGRARAHLTRALWLHPPFLRRGWILDMYLKALVGSRFMTRARSCKERVNWSSPCH